MSEPKEPYCLNTFPIFEEAYLATIPLPPDPDDPSLVFPPEPTRKRQSAKRESRWDCNFVSPKKEPLKNQVFATSPPSKGDMPDFLRSGPVKFSFDVSKPPPNMFLPDFIRPSLDKPPSLDVVRYPIDMKPLHSESGVSYPRMPFPPKSVVMYPDRKTLPPESGAMYSIRKPLPVDGIVNYPIGQHLPPESGVTCPIGKPQPPECVVNYTIAKAPPPASDATFPVEMPLSPIIDGSPVEKPVPPVDGPATLHSDGIAPSKFYSHCSRKSFKAPVALDVRFPAEPVHEDCNPPLLSPINFAKSPVKSAAGDFFSSPPKLFPQEPIDAPKTPTSFMPSDFAKSPDVDGSLNNHTPLDLAKPNMVTSFSPHDFTSPPILSPTRNAVSSDPAPSTPIGVLQVTCRNLEFKMVNDGSELTGSIGLLNVGTSSTDSESLSSTNKHNSQSDVQDWDQFPPDSERIATRIPLDYSFSATPEPPPRRLRLYSETMINGDVNTKMDETSLERFSIGGQEQSYSNESNEPSVNGECGPNARTPKAAFGKFKFLRNSASSINLEDNSRTGRASASEDSDSCGGSMLPSAVSSELEELTASNADSQSSCGPKELTANNELVEPSPPKPPAGRRRKGTHSPKGNSEEPPGGRRRSSRIRCIEERKEKEREEKTKGTKKPEDKDKSESMGDEPSATESCGQNADDAIKGEQELHEGSQEDDKTEPHEIALPSMPTPKEPPSTSETDVAPMSPLTGCSANGETSIPDGSPPSGQFVAPLALATSSNGPATSPSESTSPDDASSVHRPLKVKSRWRRHSEMEGSLPYHYYCSRGSSSISGQSEHPVRPEVLNTPPLPPPPFQCEAPTLPCHTALPLPPPTSPEKPDFESFSFTRPTCETAEIQLPPALKNLSIAPTGFFEPGEITEDWSEKEVTSSLTQNPLPLRLRVVHTEPERTADSPSSKHVKSSSVPSWRDRPPPFNFDEIPENVYLSERRRSKSKRETRRMICDCTLTEEELERGFVGCGDECLNRLLMMECGSRCPTGENCTNRRFQKKEYAKIDAFKTEKKGWGLRTMEDLPTNAFVMEYVGEVLDQREFKRRVKDYASDRNRHYYFMALRADEIIDATQKGNQSRFINHSCDPNCETQKWTVNGELRVGFFTRKPMSAGDELTFDYQFQRYGKEAQRCYCESSNCRGLIGGDKQTPLKKERRDRDVKKKKSAEERRREFLEDMDLEEEIEKFNQLGGLKNRNQVLNLCRLMVRAEDTESRLVLLCSLQKTIEQSCLRLFLDYHGLSLMWSWMVDIGNTDASILLKTEILKTLSALPISNKTMLMDSKITTVVEKWVVQIAEEELKNREKPNSIESTQTDVPIANAASCTEPSGLFTEESSSDSDLQQHSEIQNELAFASEHSENKENMAVDPSVHNSEAAAASAEVCGDSVQCTAEDTDKEPALANEVTCDVPAENLSSTDTILEPVAQSMETADFEEKSVSNDDDGAKVPGVESVDTKDSGSVETPESCIEEESLNSEAGNIGSEAPTEKKESEPVDKSQITNLATQLLSSWSTLKEIYRIPKREQIEKRKEHEREADLDENSFDQDDDQDRDRDNDRDRGERYRDKDRDRHRDKDQDREKDRDRDSDRYRDRDNRDRDRDWYSDRERSRDGRRNDGYERHKGGDYERSRHSHGDSPSDNDRDRDPRSQRRKRQSRFSNLDHQSSSKRMARGPPRISKEERRQLFELKVQQEEEEVMRRQQEEYFRLRQEAQMMTNEPIYYEPNFVPPPVGIPPPFFDPATCYSMPPPDTSMMPPMPVPDPAAMPGGIPTLLGCPGPVPPPMTSVLPIDRPLTDSPITSMPPPMIPPVIPSSPSMAPMLNSTIPYDSSMPLDPSAPFDHMANSNAPPTIVYPVFPPSNSQIPNQVPGYIPPPVGTPHYVPPPAQPVYYSTPQGMVLHLPDQQTWPPIIPAAVQPAEEMVPPPPDVSKTLKPPKLPPNWKTAKDAEGNTYYYHAVTRVTQWEPPSYEEAEMDVTTPPYDDQLKVSKKKTTTAAADTSSEFVRRTKELFRSKISQFIVQCLNPYRKPDCKLGRIVSTDDFKHLARKLTHFVLAKEMKHCRNIEDLECNDNVKHKAKDFIKKYMSKFGPVFKNVRAISPKDDDDDD